MTIIDQLEQSVTPAILGESSSVAHISLLEQFYAILVSRLSLPEVYSGLLRNQNLSVEIDALIEGDTSFFAQLWPDESQRQFLVTELAAMHHIDANETKQLITNAAHLSYQELKTLANNQFLPAYLQAQQPSVRPYLPFWAPTVISTSTLTTKTVIADNEAVVITKEVIDSNYEGLANTESIVAINLINDDITDSNVNSDAIHANPSEYRTAQTLRDGALPRQYNNWLIPLLLAVIALAGLALLWFLVIQPKYMQPVVPVIVEPAPIVIEENIVAPLLPIELNVSVDNSGGLYNCTAMIGDATLQTALQQAFNSSFGEQSANCELTVKQGVATTLTNMPIEALPQVLTLIRAVPFARLQLQQGNLILEAPDTMFLQQLADDIRSLLPNMTVTTIDPVPLPNNNSNESLNNEMSNNDINNGFNDNDEVDNRFDNNSNANFNNTTNQEQNYQESDDDTNDSVVPTQQSRDNLSNNRPITPSGPISPSEVDNLTNPIVSEQLRNARPVDKNIASDR